MADDLCRPTTILNPTPLGNNRITRLRLCKIHTEQGNPYTNNETMLIRYMSGQTSSNMEDHGDVIKLILISLAFVIVAIDDLAVTNGDFGTNTMVHYVHVPLGT